MMNGQTIKIWVTYSSAGSLHAGGLERCTVWFRKPVYAFLKNTRDWEDEDMPFTHNGEQLAGVQKWGWITNPMHHLVEGSKEQQTVSFGNLFGYDSDLAYYVWGKLQEFFGDTNLRHWSDIEKKDKNKQPHNFILELDLAITLLIKES